MKCKILHRSEKRIRVKLIQKRMTVEQADILEAYLLSKSGITSVKVYDRTCDAVICFSCDFSNVAEYLSEFAYTEENAALVTAGSGRELNNQYEEKLVMAVLKRFANRLIFPAPIRIAVSVFRSLKYIKEGLKCLAKGKIEVAVLDATAIAVSMLRGDTKTASSVMFMLNIGEILDEWTHRKSVDDLARTMSLGIEKVWLNQNGQDILVSLNTVKKDDILTVRTGSVIPLDSIVVSGNIMVNQSSMTGESIPVSKSEGGYVYGGTVVEDGECQIKVQQISGNGKYDRIVKMIESSEKLKSQTEDKASHLADKLVPYSLIGTALTYLLTQNVQKALSILMVDFSCALKLAMPVTVLSAIRDCSKSGITVKGGKFLEAVSEADTIVFDKTGTLTHAQPKVAEIITFNGKSEEEMLRLAACLEEHYPHSIANAVVQEAEKRGLLHEERHSEIEYIVAHGISSKVDGEKVIIGSSHFVFEDENCSIPNEETEKYHFLPDEYSHLYLAISGILSAVICIEDPLRNEAHEVIEALHILGIPKIVMMTGDTYKTAESVAEKVGVDEFYAEVLPEDKAEFIRKEHEQGRKVIMLGDGINDSPALSEADAGIAISSGAAIAREIADITISADDLYSVVLLKHYSDLLMNRIHRNYHTIIGFNGMLIAGGVLGILPPSVSAFLHNASTLMIGLNSMRPLDNKNNIK
ncbi:MAG: heavy metal translocating P-type ATPase [Ruminococcus sp.]|nr:heavy metal translocating P-type ATPase [Ruminococcus sp.]